MTRGATSVRDSKARRGEQHIDVPPEEARSEFRARRSWGFDDCWDLVGAPVETCHGSGIVRHCVERDGHLPVLVVDLVEAPGAHGADSLPEGAVDAPGQAVAGAPPLRPDSQAVRRVLRVTADKLRKKPVCAPGTCVDTKYGKGVLVAFRPKDDIHVVRLWRPKGRGSALAYLVRSSLLGKLPTVPGMRVSTPDGHGVAVRLIRRGGRHVGEKKADAVASVVAPNSSIPTSSETDVSGSGSADSGLEAADVKGSLSYIVEVTNDDDGSAALVEGEDVCTPIAKVMPLVERVVDRSNRLVSKANIGASARDLLAKIEDPAGLLVDAKDNAKAAHEAAADDKGGDSEAGVRFQEAESRRDQEQRAEHLTELARIEANKFESLLASGRQSLEDLIARTWNGNPGDGLGLEEGLVKARAELTRLWEEVKDQVVGLAGEGAKALEIDQRFASLRSLAKDNADLAKIVAEIETGAAKARELQSQLEATKTVGLLLDGKTRLETGLGEVLDAYRDDAGVAAAKERGGRLLKALTEEDSLAVTKGVRLLQGARERVLAQGGGWQNALARWKEPGCALDGRGRFSDVLTNAAQGVSNGGAGVQDVVQLLKGDPASRAKVASVRLLENFLLAFIEAVPRPRPARTVLIGDVGDSSVVGQRLGGGEEGDVEGCGVLAGEGNEDEWDGTWCAQDLVERFESGQLAEEIVRGMTQQASTHALSYLDRVSATNLVEGSEGWASLKLLERYRSGEAGLDDAVTYALEFLNSDQGGSLAGGLVSRGERGLESLKTMSGDGAVGRVLERLVDPGLEKRIMRGIAEIDTDQLLDTAEKAISDAETRARLLDEIKSSTLDFLLDYLPNIEVPPVAGKSTRVSYAIANLDLSGFRLRKEDVEVQVIDLSSGVAEGATTSGSTGDGMGTAARETDGRNGQTNCRGAGVDSRGGLGVSVMGGDAFGDDREMAAVPWATVTREAVHSGGLSFASPAAGSELPAAGGMIAGSVSRKPPDGEISAKGSLAYPYCDDAVEEAFLDGVCADIGEGLGMQQSVGPSKMPREELKPAEVLKVVARGVGAEFKTLQWASRQEMFPYTRFAGTADAAVVDGYVSLGFSIKRGVVDPEKGLEGPLLVLSTRTVSLDRLDLTVSNCRMSWLINLLTRLFASTISTYVCRALQQQLDAHASDLLGAINGFAEGSWPFLLGLTNVNLQDLPLANETELAMAHGEGRPEGVAGIVAGIAGLGSALGINAGDGGAVEHRPLDEAFVTEGSGLLKLKGFVQEDFAVVFDEDGPLGMQVDVEKGTPGRIMVSGLHPEGQAERLLGAPAGGSQSYSLVGSELITVGGTNVMGVEGRKVFGILKSCPRPVQMTFRCAVPDVAEEVAAAIVGGKIEEPPPPEGLVKATFKQKSLGVKFRASSGLGTRVTRVGGFSRDPEGRMREAEASGLMVPGQLLYSVNGKRVLGREFTELVRGLQKVGRPVEFGLVHGVDVNVHVEGPPLELELRKVSGRVTVIGFCEVPTALEATGAIQPGDIILSVNGIPLPGPRSYEKDEALLKAPGMFPMRLRIHRPKQGAATPEVGHGAELAEGAPSGGGVRGSGMGAGLEGPLSRLKQYQSAVSTSATEVVAETAADLSLCVEQGLDGRPVVRSMPYVKGRLEKGGIIQPGMVLVGVGGVPVIGGHFGSVSNCRRTLNAAVYPCTLTFRDMPRYVWLSRLLAMGTPS